MPVKRLPPNPNLDHLKYQAKDLLEERTAAHTLEVAQRIREFHPGFRRATDAEIFDAQLSLSDAQLTIAREYGFPSWARLKRHIEKPTLSDRLDLPHQGVTRSPSSKSAWLWPTFFCRTTPAVDFARHRFANICFRHRDEMAAGKKEMNEDAFGDRAQDGLHVRADATSFGPRQESSHTGKNTTVVKCRRPRLGFAIVSG
jgi:hypothetical protein